jgi:GxxExxY protein
MFDQTSPELEKMGKLIVDAAFKVHSALGPGLLESVYQLCLAHELEKRGLRVQRELGVEVVYDGLRFPAAFRIDLLVEGQIVIETKSVEIEHAVNTAQLLTYMKLTNNQLGYLINFNTPLIKDGIKRFVRTRSMSSPSSRL